MRGKRSVHRKPMDIDFVRKADGRLRPVEERDIKDIWADLDRLKLKEALERDEKKRARKLRRRELFRPVRVSDKTTSGKETSKTVEIKIHFPGLSFDWLRTLSQKVIAVLGVTTRKQRGIAAGSLVFVVLFAASFNLYGSDPKSDKDKASVLSGSSQVASQGTPDYPIVLPINKTIEDLGGWHRASPPDKEPVYAFTDQIDEVRVVISQQPLPESFKNDMAGKLAELAEQFAATEKITAGETQAYLGNDVQGSQSVILTKNGLLILAKSDKKLTNGQWEYYLAALQ